MTAILYLYFYKVRSPESHDLPKLSKKEQAAKQHELSQRLLTVALKNETGASIEQYECVKNQYGKPYLKDSPWFFNISHCSGAICCAISHQEIGVDIEPAERDAHAVIDRVCTEREKLDIAQAADKKLRFMQYWTLKECYVKYIGQGISYGMRQAEFTLKDNAPRLINSNISFQQEQIAWQGINYVIAACGNEVPMPIKIVQNL